MRLQAQGDWLHRGRRFRQVNLEMVRAGWAEVYTVPPNVRYAELYLQAAREARARGVGMWGGGPASRAGPAPGPESRKGCDPAYPTVCIPPPPPDLDCGDIERVGGSRLCYITSALRAYEPEKFNPEQVILSMNHGV